jgi:hypothetical protein
MHMDLDVYTDHTCEDDRDARDALVEMKPTFTERKGRRVLGRKRNSRLVKS